MNGLAEIRAMNAHGAKAATCRRDRDRLAKLLRQELGAIETWLTEGLPEDVREGMIASRDAIERALQ